MRTLEPQTQIVRPIRRANCRRCRGGAETFHYLRRQYLYNVDRARVLVADGREAVEVEEASVQASIDECTMTKPHIDHVDTRYPGIIAHIRHRTTDGELVRGHVLIDGHHRAARCLRDGLPFFAYLLTEAESDAILLRKPDDLDD